MNTHKKYVGFFIHRQHTWTTCIQSSVCG